MKREELYADALVVCDNTQPMRLHRLILASFSGFFDDIFRNCQKDNFPVVYLNGIDHTLFSKILGTYMDLGILFLFIYIYFKVIDKDIR